ncbi:MAG: methionyl-tRNA formyltransferase [Candidatus Buchananbacteria bacterium]|nr:methionyl-tRNA formyltransferase [Candidatus Buchananbacteria bacterium]
MPEQNQTKIVFLGTPEFAVPFLQALVANNLKPVLVISQPDRPVGRKQTINLTPVKLEAIKSNIKVEQPTSQTELKKILEETKPDVCILVAYGMIIKDEVLKIPPFGFINIHPSLLPKYRGSAPVQNVILDGQTETGLSIIKLDKKMDHGPIIAQASLPILPTDNNITLHDRLAIFGADLLVDILPKYLDDKIELIVQDDAKATYTKIIDRADGRIDWSKSAKQIEAQFRAFQPWPGVYTNFDTRRLKIADLELLEGQFEGDLKPGTVFLTKNDLPAVSCNPGAVVLKRLQIEGKKEMSAVDFLNGYKNFVGSVLN